MRAPEGQRQGSHEQGIERGGGAQNLFTRIEDQAAACQKVLRVAKGDECVINGARAGNQTSNNSHGDDQARNKPFPRAVFHEKNSILPFIIFEFATTRSSPGGYNREGYKGSKSSHAIIFLDA